MKMLMVSDAELVDASLGGQADAFGEIVDRYKGLVSAVTYNICGSLSESEELAQEVFLTAWKELRSLREPEKVKSWLCGIARRVGANKVRRPSHAITRASLSMDALSEHASSDPEPGDAAISREEESLMWRALERLPDTYREPLILFYRENSSVEAVADALEISVDAAKQRLSRGRKMLHDEVASLVESSLRRTGPGRAFTFGVVAALPMLSGSATAATVAATALKGSTTATTAASVSWLAFMGGPVIGILGAWFGVKTSLQNAESGEERQVIISWSKRIALMVVAFIALFGVVVWHSIKLLQHNVTLGVSLLAGTPLVYTLLVCWTALRCNQSVAKVKLAARQAYPTLGHPASCIREWRTKAQLFGLPLIHLRAGRQADGKSLPAMGWIAIGDTAIGIIFAGGGMAIGGIAMGGASFGLISLGGAAFGALAFGGLAVGGFAVGGIALGFYAVAGAAVGWKAAVGGLAIAGDYALGGHAIAAEANNPAAIAAIKNLPWLMNTQNWLMHNAKQFQLLVWAPVLLVFAQVYFFRKRTPKLQR